MVLVQFPDGECGDVKVNPETDSVRTLKNIIPNSYGKSQVTSLLTFKDTPLNDDSRLLSDYGIATDDLIVAQMQIYVSFLSNHGSKKGFMLDVDPYMQNIEVKFMIESKTPDEADIAQENLRLIYHGDNLDDGMNLQQCGVSDNDDIFVIIRESHAPPPKEGCIQVYIKSPFPEDKIYTLDVVLSDKIIDVKRKLIAVECNYMDKLDRMVLKFGENSLDNDVQVFDSSVSSECLLHLYLSEGNNSSSSTPGIGDDALFGFGGSGDLSSFSGNFTGGNNNRPSSAASAAASSSATNQITLYLMNNANGNVAEFKVKKDAPLSETFNEYSRREHLPMDCLEFGYGDLSLPGECEFAPEVLGINDRDTIIVRMTTTGPAAVNNNMVDLTGNSTQADARSTLILKDSTGNDVRYTIDKNNTRLSEVFYSYAGRTGMDPAQLQFAYEDWEAFRADCDLTASILGMPNGATVYVSGVVNQQHELLQQMNAGLLPASQQREPEPPQREFDLTNFSGKDELTVTLQEPGQEPRDLGLEFKINRITLLPIVYKKYCEERGAALGSLQFVLGARRLSLNANESAADIGLVDGNTIFVLHRNPDKSSGNASGGGKMNIWMLDVAEPSTKEYFRVDPKAPFRRVINAYVQKRKGERKVQLKSLRFLYGDRIVHAEGNDTALDIGLHDGATIHVLEKSKKNNPVNVPALTPNALETIYETDPDDDSTRIFEPIAQVLEVSRDTIILFDGAHSLALRHQNLGLTKKKNQHALIQVNDFSVVRSSSNKKVFSLLDVDEIAPNPGAVIGDISSFEDLNVRCDVLRAKEILARQIIADFVWRCNEQGKVHAENARKCIGVLLWRGIAAKRRMKLRTSVTLAQKLYRGHLARKIHFESVQRRLEEFRRFTFLWKTAIGQVPAFESEQTLSGWSLVREKVDLKKVEELDDDGNIAETDQKLSEALTEALQESEDSSDESSEEDEEDEAKAEAQNGRTSSPKKALPEVEVDWSQFQISAHVVKFIKNARDESYRDIFVKRMKQLAKGERSHKLQKPLKGCESVIYESYMDNSKGGFRLLWTQEGDRIVVWFIAKHKNVSRLAKLIDDAKNRTARQQLPQTFISELNADPTVQTSITNEVMLDALGNVPLKLYDVSFDNIDAIADQSWMPPMHLTEEERAVVEAKGTVLLLGRSGTGKTICISNRIEYDRQRLCHKPGFTQLFISRSSRLCKYVEKAVGDGKNDQSTFTTFDKLLHQLDLALSEGDKTTFGHRNHVDFARFKSDFYAECNAQDKVSALIVWKAIRTFLKGSIEAFQTESGDLSREYFVSEKLGRNRCKIRGDLRDIIYEIFLQYQTWLQENHLWDDCDRIKFFLKKIEITRRNEPILYDKIKRSKIYVDEVQDYLQAEILLFFYISGGPGALFLAGDPAQSVVEGTDFRFEEIRSVGHYVAGDRRHLIPEKPRVVNVNFRSHAGILNCAGGFLDLLFTYFKNSVKQLKKDHGLFKGARPGVFHKVEVEQLAALLRDSMQGAVVLTHDDSASKWKESLGYELVYGIREAKGLEFKTVIILDFFGEIPQALQKPWRDMLLSRVDDHFELDYPLVETHLKLIYTATTRCIEQLFFAETEASVAGDAVVRWLTKMKRDESNSNGDVALATINNVSDLDSMAMTNDEFCVVGIDNAELAGSSDIELDQAINYLKRAIYCFEKAANGELVDKATVHKQSVQLRSLLMTSAETAVGVEEEASHVVEKLLNENLLLECTSLLDTIIPILPEYTREKLEAEIVSKIRYDAFTV